MSSAWKCVPLGWKNRKRQGSMKDDFPLVRLPSITAIEPCGCLLIRYCLQHFKPLSLEAHSHISSEKSMFWSFCHSNHLQLWHYTTPGTTPLASLSGPYLSWLDNKLYHHTLIVSMIHTLWVLQWSTKKKADETFLILPLQILHSNTSTLIPSTTHR